MALNSIELCSSALIKLGADGISSFEDGTAEARVAAPLYPIVRDALLSAHPWSFATKKAALAPLATAPVSDFAYAHELPSDFLKALSAGDEGGVAAWSSRSSTVSCTATPRRSCSATFSRPAKATFRGTSRRLW